MTDLRVALHVAAPVPKRSLDVDALHRRARTFGWRRVLAWIAGGTALLVGAAGVGNGVLVNAGRGGREAGSEAAPHVPAVDDAQRTAGESSGAASDAAELSPSVRPSTTSVARAGAAPAPAEEFPPRDGCTLDTRDLPVDGRRVCKFTATAEGGASMSSDAPAQSKPRTEQVASGEVYLTRNGQRELAWRSSQCGIDAEAGDARVFAGGCWSTFIQPGDLVEVVLTKKAEDVFVVRLVAGKDW